MKQPSITAVRDYGDDPWRIVESAFAPADYGLNASLFALGNGFIGLRGTFEEGLPGHNHQDGCYLNGVYFSEPITYGEKAYGYAKNNERIASVALPCRLALSVDGEPVDFTQGEWLDYERALELDAGLLTRRCVWRSPAGKTLRIETRRLVSLVEDSLVLMDYRVTPVDFDGFIEIHSTLDATPPAVENSDDPRVGSSINPDDIEWLHSAAEGDTLELIQRFRSTGFVIASAAWHQCSADVSVEQSNYQTAHCATAVYRAHLAAGQTLHLNKSAVYCAGRAKKWGDPQGQLRSTVKQARDRHFDDYVRMQQEAMARFWADSDIDIGGNIPLLQGMRFNLFHLFQSLGRREGTNIAAKGLTGHGYDGHYFWDTEIYILPFFLYTQPALARNLLRYRYGLLDAARARARDLAIPKGALFPWRTIGGEECSAYYPAGTAQFHINADIAYAVQQYHTVTGDTDFIRDMGAEVVFESARLWPAIGHYNPHKGGRFCIHAVTGPDEYTAVVDNNYFTNAMAQNHLRYAVELYEWLQREYPEQARTLSQRLELDKTEVDTWRQAAEQMYLPCDDQLGIHLQDDGFIDRPRWNFEQTPADHYPLLLHYHPLVIYRHQVCKQADTVLALLLLSDHFDSAQKRRDFDYYEPLTTHDSTLSACIHSIIASEIGYGDKALHYFADVARMDLDNNHRNTQHGVHTACMGGTWLCVVQGFAGMRLHRGQLSFAPSLPEGMSHYRFRLCFQGRRLSVDVGPAGVRYHLLEGEPLTVLHNGQSLVLSGTRELNWAGERQ